MASAIVALSPSSDPSYLAYPSPVPSPNSALSTNQHQSGPAAAPNAAPQSGDALIFDTRSLSVVNVIQAHKTPIALLSINSSGSMLATCSTKGTVIRVFGLPNAEKLYQFRRGMQGARIHSITFNTVSTLLAVSSATDTVHIFKLTGGKSGSSNGTGNGRGGSSPSAASMDSQSGSGDMEGGYEAYIDGKKKGGVRQVGLFLLVSPLPHLAYSASLKRRSLHLTRNIAGSMGGYLPNTLTELWEPSRDFAYLKLPASGVRCVVALSG